MAILVLVLFFVYPLKFLFTMLTVQMFGFDLTNAPHLEGLEQVRLLYLIYGLGLAGVWGLYARLYVHALRKRDELGLSEIELVHTRASLAENLIYVAVCALVDRARVHDVQCHASGRHLHAARAAADVQRRVVRPQDASTRERATGNSLEADDHLAEQRAGVHVVERRRGVFDTRTPCR